MLRCTPNELAEVPAEKIDWFLEFESMEAEIRAEQQQENEDS